MQFYPVYYVENSTILTLIGQKYCLLPFIHLGTCVFWEFATEFYDLGFGVSFEWSQPQTKNITVAVNESDDEEFGEEDKSAENESSPPKPRVDEVLPVVRRPCNEEVIIGSHLYPGRGVYLLKFDNSYSLFRSKTLYYRVYYTR